MLELRVLFHYAAEKWLVTWYHFLPCSRSDPQGGFPGVGRSTGRLKIAADTHPLDMAACDSLREGKPSTDIYVNEGNVDFVRLLTSLLQLPTMPSV